jgi:hypothetical protein
MTAAPVARVACHGCYSGRLIATASPCSSPGSPIPHALKFRVTGDAGGRDLLQGHATGSGPLQLPCPLLPCLPPAQVRGAARVLLAAVLQEVGYTTWGQIPKDVQLLGRHHKGVLLDRLRRDHEAELGVRIIGGTEPIELWGRSLL